MDRFIRLIPRLDIKGPNLVKGIQLEGLRVLGNPDLFAKEYYRAGACELFYMDVVASLYERNSLVSMISNIAQDIFIPITVGGGLRSLEDIQKVLNNGADKVALNTAVIRRPQLISEASNKFGSSTIVVCIEAIRQPDGKYLAFIDNGREHTGVDVFQWAKEAENLGAGEIVITAVDREGSGSGFDVELVGRVSDLVKVPVVAHGGASSVDDIVQLVQQTNVNGVAVASIFHYDLITKINTLQQTKSEGNTRFLQENRAFQKIKPVSLSAVVEELKKYNIVCRSV